MRIALLTHQWPGIRMGGIGAATRQTAAALAGAGHEVHVFTLKIPADLVSSIPSNIHFHGVEDLATRVQQGTLNPALAATIDTAGEGAYRLALAWILCDALQKTHAKTPFDIIEAPEVDALALPLQLNSGFDVPIITHLHCCTALAHLGNQTPIDPSQQLTTALEFAAIHLADQICAPTQAVVRGTERFMPVPPVAIVPHPYATSQNAFTPPPVNGPMLFIGRIEQLKGVVTIAKALNDFLPQHPHALFRFIGPDTPTAPSGGSMQQYLQCQLSPEIAHRVQFTGELSHAQIENELRQCSFCVQPSYWENFSMTCCEAFAAGRTVIVGQGTGSVELIGKAGLAVDPHDPGALALAMKSLYTDRHVLDQLSQRAHTRIRSEFSPARVTDLRTSFYQRSIEGFRHKQRADLPARLATLPPAVAAAILPAFSTLTGVLAGVHRPATTPGAKLLSIMQNISSRTGKPASVLLYGAGKFTVRLLSQRALWETGGHRVVGLIDDHPRFINEPHCFNLPVQSMKTATNQLQHGTDLLPVVLSTDTYQDQFWTQTQPLRDRGIEVFRL